jgi:peptidyl-dipeptidase Dcp
MKSLSIIPVIALFMLSCNTNQKQMTTDSNPFFIDYGTPFEVPAFDRIKIEHFIPAFNEGIKQQAAEIMLS